MNHAKSFDTVPNEEHEINDLDNNGAIDFFYIGYEVSIFYMLYWKVFKRIFNEDLLGLKKLEQH